MMNMSSFSGSYKVGIIKEADYLSEEAKSALLKTLEEPEDMVVIVLLVNDLNSLPSTIASRSQILHFQPVSSEIVYDYLLENYNANRSLAKDLANLCLGRPLLAIRFLENSDKYDSYLKKASLWLDVIAESSTASRLEILNEIFKDRTWSREAVELASSILDLAEGLARDLLLISLGHKDMVQHLALLGRLEVLVRDLGEKNDVPLLILSHLKLISQARAYLAANINPRLTLEQIAINY
jgi:DNA polymerase-3 subunit delta'